MSEAGVVNLCPHPLHVEGADGVVIKLWNMNKAARVQMREVDVTEDLGFKLRVLEAGRTINLPPPTPGTRYAVSKIVAISNPHRNDLLVPDTEMGKKDCGHIVSTPGFVSLVQSDFVSEFQSIADEMIAVIGSGGMDLTCLKDLAGRLQCAIDSMFVHNEEGGVYEDI